MLAQVLQIDTPDYVGMPTDVPGKAAYALEIYHSLLKCHFELEDNALFPAIKGLDAKTDIILKRLLFRQQWWYRIMVKEALLLTDDKEGHLSSLNAALFPVGFVEPGIWCDDHACLWNALLL